MDLASPPPPPTPPPAAPQLAIGLVTFHPDPGFYDRVARACAMGYGVFVFDNSPAVTDQARLLAARAPHLHYATAGNNVGLGVGLSVVCASAYAHGCEHLLFFDQDTRFTAATLEYASALLQGLGERLRSSHAAVVLQAPRGRGCDDQPVDVLLAISSGMLFFLPNVARMGWHNPRYFVDGVDYEFCLRARSRGLRIATCSGAPGFDHVTDQADSTRVLLGRPLRLRKYPAWRVLDSMSAYLRLAASSLGRVDLPAAYSVVRSMAIFILGQCLARLPLRRAD